jgi:hypothetical protein
MSIIRDQLVGFANEYERIRATMPSGDERTRRMEVVVAKMRTLSIAGYPLLDDFSKSSSPGQRLAAAKQRLGPGKASTDRLPCS